MSVTNNLEPTSTFFQKHFHSIIHSIELDGTLFSEEQTQICQAFLLQQSTFEESLAALKQTPSEPLTIEKVRTMLSQPRYRTYFSTTDFNEYKHIERLLILKRLMELIDVEIYRNQAAGTYIQQMHAFIYQDLYPWAGTYRKARRTRGHTYFLLPGLIPEATRDFSLELEIMAAHYFPTKQEFIKKYAPLVKELHFIHPFTKGNGLASRALFRKIAMHHGYHLYYQRIKESVYMQGIEDCKTDFIESYLSQSILNEQADQQLIKATALKRKKDKK
ncbi:Fic family protein [Isobaculum melis]|uniref:protein adenylyltransferase n=1 Tax=Isobaculum melis TaxID=142588 RepID=A0A1H9SPW2_9LACT|nr:Fic family protein [Isobaculum melis]SER87006.1 Fido, protein-threonine AMPylation domain-containing protein [Isobaculum melis]